MRRKLVVGNWKMHGSAETIRQLVPAVLSGLPQLATTDVAICPPFVYLPQVRGLLTQRSEASGAEVALGAQNVASEEEGAFTGEVSASMLADQACRFVIVGHSERRSLYGEDNAVVATKAEVALRHRVTPIVCVGETLAERDAELTLDVIAAQLDALIDRLSSDAIDQVVVAYEPLWAIGTGQTATPAQAQAVHAFIRSRLDAAAPGTGAVIRILYGGSVKAENAGELFSQTDIDGGLVGGASLNADEFIAICRAAES